TAQDHARHKRGFRVVSRGACLADEGWKGDRVPRVSRRRAAGGPVLVLRLWYSVCAERVNPGASTAFPTAIEAGAPPGLPRRSILLWRSGAPTSFRAWSLEGRRSWSPSRTSLNALGKA